MPDRQSRNTSAFQPPPENWAVEFRSIDSADGTTRLFSHFHYRRPDRKTVVPHRIPRLLIVLHGLGEHGGRYAHLPYFLDSSVDAIFCYDQRGHGRSGGKRGDVTSFDEFAHDAAIAIRAAEERMRALYPRFESHLFGHSLGGHVALRAILLHRKLPLVSVMVSAPFLGIAAKVSPFKMLAARALARVCPTLGLQTGLDPNLLAHDHTVVAGYVTDPLVHGRMTPRFFLSMLRAIGDTLSRRELPIPALFLVAGDDRIVKSEVTEAFAGGLCSPKRLVSFPGFFHELVNEPGHEQVFAEMNRWLRKESPL